MRNNNFKFLVIFGIALFLAIFLIPINSGADPELPDKAFVQTIPANDPFPHQQELASRVNFWRHVFGIWGSRQVALHDMSNPGLIYEVLTLPEGSRGVNRKEFVNERIEDLMRRLYNLEQNVALGKDLDDNEQELLNKFRTLGKISQLAGAHERVRIQYGIRDKFLQGVEVSGRYDSLFRRIFRSHGVPEDLAFLPHVESSFQVNARSGAGAVGIWQFTLPAARTFMNVNAAVDERYDPVLAAEGCARYLASAYKKLGDWGLAITSYNHGIGGMSRAESEFGSDFPRILEEYEGPQFGFDSRNFYVEFLAAREVARNAERYFAAVHREHPQAWEKVALEQSAPIYKVARDYGVSLTELADMNTALTNNALKGRVSLPEGTSIWLPSGTQQRLAARSPEEENPAETQIRVVRTPDPTNGRMMAMIEDSLTVATKIDAPAVNRRAPSVGNKVNNERNAASVKSEPIKVEDATTVKGKGKNTSSKLTPIKVAPVKSASQDTVNFTRGKTAKIKVVAATVKTNSKLSAAKSTVVAVPSTNKVVTAKAVPLIKYAQVKAPTKVETTTKVLATAPIKPVASKGIVVTPIKIAMTKVAPMQTVAKPITAKTSLTTAIPKKLGGKVATVSKVASNRRG